MTSYVSLSKANQFSFTCPVFDVETKMAACTNLRDIVWRGGRPPVRKGCQAAIKCGMCPASAMISLYSFNSRFDNDHHGSTVPKSGKLLAQVLERTARAMPLDNVLTSCGVSPAERDLLFSAGPRFEEQLKTAPGESNRAPSNFEAPKKRKAKTVAPVPVNNNLKDAATTGDLAAALNAA